VNPPQTIDVYDTTTGDITRKQLFAKRKYSLFKTVVKDKAD